MKTMTFKALGIVVAVVLAVVIGSAALGFAQSDEMELGAGKAATRPPVMFTHADHSDNYDCLKCHHVYKDGVNVLDEGDLQDGDPSIQCAHCHNAHTRITLRQAFHRECVECHIKVRKAGNGNPPELCGTCHVKS